jgi:malate dehydrogenase (oxaloacetate-decarboxylating)
MPSRIIADEPQEVLEIGLTGQLLLHQPLLNKGNAFTEAERREFGLVGLLPPHISSIEVQVARSYDSYLRKDDDLERYIFLAALQDRDEVLFYRLLSEHLREMCPIVYTPVVGLACQQYSHIYRRPRGLYLDIPHQDDIEAILHNAPSQDVRVIVVTDGERILGLGDLGVGGMDIPVGKLTLYTLCAGIHPATTLPILLDVGTDNQSLLADPLYLGWHHERVRGAAYDAFIEAFVQAVKRTFPGVLLQWEDFAKGNARRLLNRYQHELCTFNDDIQGTGAVTLAGLLTAVKRIGSKLSEQTIVILGAGSAATGIAEQIVTAMISEGQSPAAARAALWLIDRQGLVHTGRRDLDSEKALYAQAADRIAAWPHKGDELPGLQEVIEQVHPTILIGTAAQAGAFTEPVVREMARHVAHPIIFPLSNPTSKSEAVPADLIAWTEGRALIATGSPFPDVSYCGRTLSPGQCNNMFIFPGMGLGILAAQARQVTNTMFLAAAHALSAYVAANQSLTASLYPSIEMVRDVARRVAVAVGLAAQQEGVAEPMPPEVLEQRVKATMWVPSYPQFTYKSPAWSERDMPRVRE